MFGLRLKCTDQCMILADDTIACLCEDQLNIYPYIYTLHRNLYLQKIEIRYFRVAHRLQYYVFICNLTHSGMSDDISPHDVCSLMVSVFSIETAREQSDDVGSGAQIRRNGIICCSYTCVICLLK